MISVSFLIGLAVGAILFGAGAVYGSQAAYRSLGYGSEPWLDPFRPSTIKRAWLRR